MTRYIATNHDTGLTAEYESAAPNPEHLGPEWDLEAVSVATLAPDAEPPVPTVYGGRRRLTKLEFIALLGDAPYVAILAMARASVEVEAWTKMLELATTDADGASVDLDEPRTIAGVRAIGAALQQQGVVDGAWADGVLNG